MNVALISEKRGFNREPEIQPTRAASKFCGLLNRKERWGLSFKGWLAVVVFAVGAGLVVFFEVYPFLAVTARVDTNILVVEGWVHQNAIQAGVKEFKTGPYQRIFATGGPVVGNGGYVNDFQTSASVGADLLIKYGIPSQSVQMVPSHVLGRDRTYSSAVALRDWFREHNLQVRSINVLTEDVHARRTRLLFQKALGSSVRVGVISIPHPDYDARHWWRYSEGVKDALGESVAYVYARVFFHPN
jgi:uncharacterized SAM-binding protein YcdF (DUF218 family)